MDTAKPTGILRKEFLGIPVIIWGGIAVGILVFIAYRTPKTSTAESAASDNTDGTAGDGGNAAANNAANGTFVADPGIVNPAPVTPEPVAVIETNAQWANKAVGYLVASGSGSPDAIQRAISKYLAGNQLSTTEGAWRDAAIRQFGPPPEGVTSGGTAPTPARAQGTPPLTHTVKGSSDNTYTELAVLYYGSSDPEKWTLIQAANPSLPPTGAHPVGTRIYIPRYVRPQYYTTTAGVDTAKEIAAKNGTTAAQIVLLNPSLHFPVKQGTRVRVK